MGKGDIRTRRGKIWRRTYGVTRPRRWKTTTPAIVAKPRKVKALKDLPKAVEAEQLKKIVVEAVKPQHIEIKAHVPEVKSPVVTEVHQPVVAETAPVIEVHAVETAHAEVEVKSTAKKPVAQKAPAKKTPAAKKPATAKKAPAKKKK